MYNYIISSKIPFIIIANKADKIAISIVEENKKLKEWYIKFGFTPVYTRKYDFFPFTCGYMEKILLK